MAFFDNWVSTTSPSTAFDLLPPNDLFVLSNTLHHSTEAESILVALRSRMGAHHQYLIKLLFYDQTPFSLRCQLYWEKLMDAEHFFRDQTSQIKSISGDSNPPGPTRFLRSLFTLRSTHVLHAWGALRETKQIITNAESCRVQTYVVLSSWIAHAILLMVGFVYLLPDRGVDRRVNLFRTTPRTKRCGLTWSQERLKSFSSFEGPSS